MSKRLKYVSTLIEHYKKGEKLPLTDKEDIFLELLGLPINCSLNEPETIIELCLDHILKVQHNTNRITGVDLYDDKDDNSNTLLF